ncbi:MAG: glycogen synthase GlgA [Desulfuromonadales bacterium]
MAESPLKLLIVASEAAPFAKTGGLADVVGSLPPALHALGHDVRLIIPWYRAVRKATGNLRAGRKKLTVPMGGRVYLASWRTGENQGMPVYFLDAPEFYDRPGLYGERGQDYHDNAERFGMLSRAALELARQIDFAPDVIHAHDWQTGLVPVYLHQHLWRDPFFADTGSLFTIHNLGYQGVFPQEMARFLALDNPVLSPDGLEYFGQISLLKGGISFATRVNTVSPTYCQEIQTPQHGMGLDGLLRSRGEHLHGLLNGLDGDLWSPARDKSLASSYSTKQLSGKKECKKQLQKELGLRILPNTPIVAMVTRLDSQKGIELVLESWDRLMRQDLQLVILGSGNPDFERRLAEAASYYPGKASVLLQFDESLARRIYAGSDIFMMPSRYEPCGLGQLIALRYGSVPLVHATGGLADTITDPLDPAQRGNGFAFQEYRHDSFLACLGRALETYAKTHAWRAIMLRGMQQDFSWRQAAGEYVKLYRMCTKESR